MQAPNFIKYRKLEAAGLGIWNSQYIPMNGLAAVFDPTLDFHKFNCRAANNMRGGVLKWNYSSCLYQ